MIKDIIETFPEPFRSAVRLDRFRFDYRLNEGKDDHKFLKDNGYKITYGSDSACYIKGLGRLNPTSYGWGSIYSSYPSNEETVEGYGKSFYEFCRMYGEGIVYPYRISIFSDFGQYEYEEGTWKKYDEFICEWKKCKDPVESLLRRQTIDLPLKKEWYGMIESGAKTEEYREITPYWCNRLLGPCPLGEEGFWTPVLERREESARYGGQGIDDSLVWRYGTRDYSRVRFRYGYTKRTMTFRIDGIRIGKGIPEWGAPADRNVFIIKIGKREDR